MKQHILFVHPGNHKKNYQDLAKEFTAVATPAWTLLIASYLRLHQIPVAFYDSNVKGWDASVASELIKEFSPVLVVMLVYGHNPSASTQTMPAARKIASDFKKTAPYIPIAFGGTHPSALPERTLNEEPIDFVIQGEGVYTLKDLAQSLLNNGLLNGIGGLWYRENGLNIFGGTPRLVRDLDMELPGYAWDLLPSISDYRAHNMHCFQDFENSLKVDFSDVRTPYVAMNTSLGCPFSCHYCCINALFGKPGIRYWSVDTVLSWIDELVIKYGVRNIRFDDELFLLSSQRVEEFCVKLAQRGYNLNLWVYGRVDTIKTDLLEKMRKAGITWICLGIESGNAYVLENVNKKNSKDIASVVTSIQSHGMYVLGNYMFGLPEDTLETMKETMDLAVELNTEFANFYCVMAYPGSTLYDNAIDKYLPLPDGWDGFSQHGYVTKPLPTNHISAREVLKFRDNAFNTYHSSPKYLKMMQIRFGNRVVEHLERMLSVKVRRKLLEDN